MTLLHWEGLRDAIEDQDLARRLVFMPMLDFDVKPLPTLRG